ncbi:MAG TPA: hypothetical protein VLL52_09205 [Anaerolineae bacterium]|nr:hypothetical protein [Anaerolineae bacterium]
MFKALMRKSWVMGYLLGVKVKMTAAGLVTSVVLWLLGIGAGVWFGLPWGTAVGVGFVLMLVHWFGDVWHQLGHLVVGRREGYQMEGLVFVWGLVGSYYPKDEPELAPIVHIKRALGGPIATFLLVGIIGAIILVLGPERGTIGYGILQFAFWENLVLIGLGAFVPLGFTDGSSLLEWVPKWRAER